MNALRSTCSRLVPVLFGSLVLACGDSARRRAEAPPAGSEPSASRVAYAPDLELSRAPFEQVHADWKERLPQPYAFVEHVGSYVETGRELEGLLRGLRAAGIEPVGPPFGLFYDDPGRVPVERLRSRACFPIDPGARVPAGLGQDVLPSQTVVYALVAGPYPEVPRALPGLYAFAARMGWVEDGPVREVYLVPPSEVESWDQLVTELQLPVRQGS